MRMHRPLPKAIANAPELNLGLEFVYSAYWDLSTCRDYGWGCGPIPWTSIFDFAKGHELDADETEEFVHLIRSMDKAHLEHINAENEKKATNNAK
jgi:hypothetical protein